MADSSDADTIEFVEYLSELHRVCPEAADGLVFAGSPPPALSVQHRLKILRSLPDYAGVGAFLTAWLSFVGANPSAVVAPGATYEPDFYVSRGEGTVIGPPSAPVTPDDLYRALLLSGEPEEDARQIADDHAQDVDRPGVFWVGDTLLYVALLSPEHEERIQEYLKLDRPRLALELARVREALAARASRASDNPSGSPNER